jgi:hypothetical protein
MDSLESEKITLIVGNEKKNLGIVKLPKEFLQWQSEARLKMFDRIMNMGAEKIKMQTAHLPVLATLGKGNYPNLTCKGMGLLPKDEKISHFTDKFNETTAKCKELDWKESIPIRVKIIRSFYENLNNFNPYILGGLEIFEGNSLLNLKSNPFASLLYYGEAPKFPSYQFNGVVKLVPKDDSQYLFLRAARELFAFDSFHIPQIDYPFGLLFYVAESINKTPYPRR